MALRAYRYKPYHSRRKNKRSRRVLTFLFLLIVIIAVIVMFKSCREDNAIEIEETATVPAETVKPVPLSQRNTMAMPPAAKTQTPVAAPVVETPPAKEEPAPAPVVIVPEQPTLKVEDQTNIEKLKQIEAQATQYIQDKKLIAARDLLNNTLKMALTAQQRNDLKKTLATLAQKWLFSDQVLPDDNICAYHKVKPGQVPAIIGNEYHVPWQFLLKINNIAKPENLWAGAKIKVVNGPFTLKIYRSTFTMDLFIQGMYVKSYKVGLGKIGPGGNPTPTGLWRVKSFGKGKLIRPPWPDPVTGKLTYYEDPDYPLGERWIGIDGIEGLAKDRTGFGIHGTNQPDSIGKYASDGCIRMLNAEVIELYDMVTEGLTEIQIVD